jgi:glycosyltransferase involved in cell wall biosynthesis
LKKHIETSVKLALCLLEIGYLPFLALLCISARFYKKSVDVGLGPEPLINNIYHKKALEKYGYSAETYVTHTYFITKEFDKNFAYDKKTISEKVISLIMLRVLHVDFIYAIFRYKCQYIYFNGGALRTAYILWPLEPLLLRISGVVTVVMPYGGDIMEADKTPNLCYRHAMVTDYPGHRFHKKRIAKKNHLWTSHANHVISGCDWVDYMYHWDTLMVAHFSIDMSLHNGERHENSEPSATFRILHAPNHRNIKGTKFVIEAVEALKQEGEKVDLIMLERVSNQEVLEEIQKADLVVNQLIIGWYAMFAIEAMASSKPVICYLREDLLNLYRCAGLIANDEPPLINSNPLSLKDDLRRLINDRESVRRIGIKGRQYVERVHSLEYVGSVFDSINKSIGLSPSLK